MPQIREPSFWERLEAITLPITEKRRLRGDLITTFKSLNPIGNVESEQFLETGKERSTRGHSKEVKNVRKKFKDKFL